MAARYQPEVTDKNTGEKRPNPEYNEERYSHWLDKAREAHKAAAPYYAPRLMAVAFGGNIAVTEGAESRVDPRQFMWETYLGMRRRGELAQKVVESAQDRNWYGFAYPCAGTRNQGGRRRRRGRLTAYSIR
jgi:hypothetical protein